MIKLTQVSRLFTGSSSPAVACLDLSIHRGELMALVGRSGSGKTTTLGMINRLQEVSSGVICVDVRNIADMDAVQLRRGMGYLVQDVGLFPHMDVAIVPRLLAWNEDDVQGQVNTMLAMVHLPPDAFATRRPDSLSGGQRQRVGLARALAGRPPVLLLADRIAVMEDGQMLQVATPEELLNQPAHPTVERLLATPRRQVRHIENLLAPGGGSLS